MSITERPYTQPSLTTTDKLIENMCRIGFVATWVLPLTVFQSLPDIIPSHFNGRGDVDGYIEKQFLLLLPAIASLIFVLLNVAGRYPHKLNYPVPITEQNAEKQYRFATRTLRTLKFSATILLLAIELEVIFPAVREQLGLWVPFIGIILVIAPVSYQMIASLRHK